MKTLMIEYAKTADLLYCLLQEKRHDESTKKILRSEYQHTCDIRRHLESYCKARGLL